MRIHRSISVLAALILALCGAGGCGDDPIAPTSDYDGAWCMYLTGPCTGASSDLEITNGVATGTLAVTGTNCSGTLNLRGAVYTASVGTVAQGDFGSLVLSGAATGMFFEFRGALTTAGGGGDWWSSDMEKGTFEIIECPVP